MAGKLGRLIKKQGKSRSWWPATYTVTAIKQLQVVGEAVGSGGL